jgi:nicotinate-nucleotide adenylyltransferase
MSAFQAAAVFGGSFNPPHVAHQMVCLYVLETHAVDRLIVVPTFRHPFDKALAPFEDRLEMCRRAMAALAPRVEVSAIEEEIGGESSRTLITLETLQARMPGVRLRLVIGADLLAERDKWWRWPDIEKLAPPIVVGRQGYDAPPTTPPVEVPGVSSTAIRERLQRGQSIAGLVPRSVAVYIAERKLYQ